MDHGTAYCEGSRKIPPQGAPQSDGEETQERTGRIMGLSPTGVCDRRVRISGGGDLISRQQNKVTQFIETRLIMDLCLAAQKRP